MYNISKITNTSIESIDKISKIDLTQDVVISTPENLDIIDFNLDGRIFIKTDKDINFTFSKTISGYVPVLRQQIIKIPLKLYIPYGYTPYINFVRNTTWVNTLIPKYESYSGFIVDNDFVLNNKTITIESCNPNYIVYNNFSLNMIINTELLKKEQPSMTIMHNNPICELNIFKNISNNFASGKIFYIINNEIYYKLLDTL